MRPSLPKVSHPSSCLSVSLEWKRLCSYLFLFAIVVNLNFCN